MYKYYGHSSLARVNYEATLAVVDYLGIEIGETLLESDFILPDGKDNRTVEIMRILRGTILICGDGASTTVHDIGNFREHDFNVHVVPFFSEHPRYRQIHFLRSSPKFERGLSFVDALLNVGKAGVRDLIIAVGAREYSGN